MGICILRGGFEFKGPNEVCGRLKVTPFRNGPACYSPRLTSEDPEALCEIIGPCLVTLDASRWGKDHR
jgi:hypothetical protein